MSALLAARAFERSAAATIFRAGSRTRGRGTFVSAKVPKAIPPVAWSSKTTTAPRTLLRRGVPPTGHPSLTAGARTSCPRPCGLSLLAAVLGTLQRVRKKQECGIKFVWFFDAPWRPPSTGPSEDQARVVSTRGEARMASLHSGTWMCRLRSPERGKCAGARSEASSECTRMCTLSQARSRKRSACGLRGCPFFSSLFFGQAKKRDPAAGRNPAILIKAAA